MSCSQRPLTISSLPPSASVEELIRSSLGRCPRSRWRMFWYIVFWIADQKLHVRPYLLDQSDDIEQAGELEVDLQTPALVTDTTVQ